MTSTLSLDWINQTLRSRGHLSVGQVTTYEFRDSLVASATVLRRLCLTYSDDAPPDAPKTLIYKVYEADRYYSDGLREWLFYTQLAVQSGGIRMPVCYGEFNDNSQQLCILLLEDLSARYAMPIVPLPSEIYESIIDELLCLQGAWWQHSNLDQPSLMLPHEDVLRMAQALPAEQIYHNALVAKAKLDEFVIQEGGQLSSQKKAFLYQLVAYWPMRFVDRIQAGQNLTLLHGDFHLFGNIYLPKAKHDMRPCILDWAQHKCGIGPFDLAYLLTPIEHEAERVDRDLRLLRYYYAGLVKQGVREYSWEQCIWDFRFSILTNTFTSIFQGSLRWLKQSLQIVASWNCIELLE